MRVTTVSTGTKGRIQAVLITISIMTSVLTGNARIIALFFMLAAITIYVLSDDLAFLPHLQ